jgi:subtilase family serine protease
VAESDETNNTYEIQWSATPTKPNAPVPNAAQADLTVSAIKVNGQVPDGKDDCKDGKNTVTIRVKNQGEKKAGDFVVRLLIDDAQADALDQGLNDGLDAGKEATVTFEGVRLKQGPHSLTATADAPNNNGTGIGESDKSNNTLKVTARCEDDD